MNFKLDQGELDVYSLLQSSDEFAVPTPSNYDSSFTVESIDGGDTVVYKLYTQTQVSNTDGGWLVIALQNNYGSDIELEIEYTTEADTIEECKNFLLDIENSLILISNWR